MSLNYKIAPETSKIFVRIVSRTDGIFEIRTYYVYYIILWKHAYILYIYYIYIYRSTRNNFDGVLPGIVGTECFCFDDTSVVSGKHCNPSISFRCPISVTQPFPCPSHLLCHFLDRKLRKSNTTTMESMHPRDYPTTPSRVWVIWLNDGKKLCNCACTYMWCSSVFQTVADVHTYQKWYAKYVKGNAVGLSYHSLQDFHCYCLTSRSE